MGLLSRFVLMMQLHRGSFNCARKFAAVDFDCSGGRIDAAREVNIGLSILGSSLLQVRDSKET